MNASALTTRSRARADQSAAAWPRSERWLGSALIVLGACIAALSLLGPLLTGVIDYRVSHIHQSQLLGLDAVSLVIVAPLAILAGVLALRRRPEWPLLAIGPALYVIYMVPQYVLGPDYLGRSGNNERFFPLFLVLFVIAAVAAVAAWNAIDLDRLPTSSRAERLVASMLLPVAAFVVFSRYVPALSDTMSASPGNEEYLAGPVFLWTIALLDLGVALPATVAACRGLRRGTTWGRKALYAVVSWFALVGVAVGAMAVATYLRDDPASSVASAAMMVVLGLGFAAIAAFLAAPLVRRQSKAAGPPDDRASSRAAL
ncbi:MAG: hypothetical protein ACRDPC_09450 [Solirubrobacteraceae bacterium]